jgi:hypothetical protein
MGESGIAELTCAAHGRGVGFRKVPEVMYNSIRQPFDPCDLHGHWLCVPALLRVCLFVE